MWGITCATPILKWTWNFHMSLSTKAYAAGIAIHWLLGQELISWWLIVTSQPFLYIAKYYFSMNIIKSITRWGALVTNTLCFLGRMVQKAKYFKTAYVFRNSIAILRSAIHVIWDSMVQFIYSKFWDSKFRFQLWSTNIWFHCKP